MAGDTAGAQAPAGNGLPTSLAGPSGGFRGVLALGNRTETYQNAREQERVAHTPTEPRSHKLLLSE